MGQEAELLRHAVARKRLPAIDSKDQSILEICRGLSIYLHSVPACSGQGLKGLMICNDCASHVCEPQVTGTSGTDQDLADAFCTSAILSEIEVIKSLLGCITVC